MHQPLAPSKYYQPITYSYMSTSNSLPASTSGHAQVPAPQLPQPLPLPPQCSATSASKPCHVSHLPQASEPGLQQPLHAPKYHFMSPGRHSAHGQRLAFRPPSKQHSSPAASAEHRPEAACPPVSSSMQKTGHTVEPITQLVPGIKLSEPHAAPPAGLCATGVEEPGPVPGLESPARPAAAKSQTTKKPLYQSHAQAALTASGQKLSQVWQMIHALPQPANLAHLEPNEVPLSQLKKQPQKQPQKQLQSPSGESTHGQLQAQPNAMSQSTTQTPTQSLSIKFEVQAKQLPQKMLSPKREQLRKQLPQKVLPTRYELVPKQLPKKVLSANPELQPRQLPQEVMSSKTEVQPRWLPLKVLPAQPEEPQQLVQKVLPARPEQPQQPPQKVPTKLDDCPQQQPQQLVSNGHEEALQKVLLTELVYEHLPHKLLAAQSEEDQPQQLPQKMLSTQSAALPQQLSQKLLPANDGQPQQLALPIQTAAPLQQLRRCYQPSLKNCLSSCLTSCCQHSSCLRRQCWQSPKEISPSNCLRMCCQHRLLHRHSSCLRRCCQPILNHSSNSCYPSLSQHSPWRSLSSCHIELQSLQRLQMPLPSLCPLPCQKHYPKSACSASQWPVSLRTIPANKLWVL